MVTQKHRQPRDSRIHSEEKLPAKSSQKQFVSRNVKSEIKGKSKSLYTEIQGANENSTIIQQFKQRKAKIEFMQLKVIKLFCDRQSQIRSKIQENKAELRQIQMKQRHIDKFRESFINRTRLFLDAEKDKGHSDSVLLQNRYDRIDRQQQKFIVWGKQLEKKKDKVQNSLAANEFLLRKIQRIVIDKILYLQRESLPSNLYTKTNHPIQK